eukprot:6413233-Pyramimonas_sp.AAC.1
MRNGARRAQRPPPRSGEFGNQAAATTKLLTPQPCSNESCAQLAVGAQHQFEARPVAPPSSSPSAQ